MRREKLFSLWSIIFINSGLHNSKFIIARLKTKRAHLNRFEQSVRALPQKSKREAEGRANMNYAPGDGGMAESLDLQGFRRKKSDLLIIGKVICETSRRLKIGEFERWCD
jgi:hypothetical protein